VYNGERHLRMALDRLLAQTLEDFELVISDNASTDGTRRICEEYARSDARVRYVRQPRNIGAARNWNAVFRETRGEYFKWASGNDFCAPTYLERGVGALEADPGAVLCYGRTQLLDENGDPIELYEGDLDAASDRPSARVARIRDEWVLNNAQQGVIRASALRKTRLDRSYPKGDLALMAELALYGRLLLLPDVLLYRRQSAGSMMAMRTPEQIHRMYNPNAPPLLKKLYGQYTGRFFVDHLVSAARAPIPFDEKVRAWGHAFRRTGAWRALGRLTK
jgi:glycosyltransferase involved in cell wall biosynthesis